MSHITINQANLTSLPALNRIFVHAVEKHFGYFPPDVRTRVVGEHNLARLARAKLDPRRVLLLARSDEEIIGYAIGAAPKTGPAQLYWLYVDPAHRGANIGLSLLSRMLKILAEKGAQEVSIATYDHRRYYERQGFKFRSQATVDGVVLDILTFPIT